MDCWGMCVMEESLFCEGEQSRVDSFLWERIVTASLNSRSDRLVFPFKRVWRTFQLESFTLSDEYLPGTRLAGCGSHWRERPVPISPSCVRRTSAKI